MNNLTPFTESKIETNCVFLLNAICYAEKKRKFVNFNKKFILDTKTALYNPINN